MAQERNRSLWIDTSPSTDYPGLCGDIRVDVAVVGGGIAGLTTALLLKRSGASVAVIEADRLAAGTTGHTTAKVTSLHGLTYAELRSKSGDEKARLYAEANQAAIEKVAALAEEMSIDCNFERRSAYTYTQDEGQRSAIEAEVEAVCALGLAARFVEDTELPYPVAAAVRLDNQAQVHPRRYCLALAEAIDGGGSYVFERSRALDVDEGDVATVITDGGRVVARCVVLATLLPFMDRGGFFAKAQAYRSYAMAIRVGGSVPEGMYLSVDSPSRSVRAVDLGGTQGLVVGGGSHGTGQSDDTNSYYDDLERWARSVFDVTAVDYRWSAQDYVTVDKIPYVGRSPRMSRTFVATGFRKWGMTNATAAAMVLAGTISGRDHPWASLYDSTRIGGAEAVKNLVKDNLGVAKRLVGGQARRMKASALAHLGPDEGGVVEVDGRSVGAYRDTAGDLHAVSLTCTHIGCTVRWNPAEATWDCPCHGSRFTCTGEMLQGPATKDLETIPVD
ncbi:MAG: FAD-dependent oxidoreductase [Acidimicrobiales bacterium]